MVAARTKDIDRQSLEAAAKSGYWKNIPKEILTEELMTELNSDGLSLLHIAAYFNKLKFVPKNLLTKNTISQKSSIAMAVVAIAAKNNRLIDIPKELITPDILDIKDEEHNTVLHFAIAARQISLIDKKILNQKNLMATNHCGKTPIDFLIYDAQKTHEISEQPWQELQHLLKKLDDRAITRSLNNTHKNREKIINLLTKELKDRKNIRSLKEKDHITL